MNQPLTSTQVKDALSAALSRHFASSPAEATDDQMYKAAAAVVRDMLVAKRAEFDKAAKAKQAKRVYYFSIEFLVGRSLKNNLFNLGLTNCFEEALGEMGFSLENLFELEPDAGLGNGGLGRLAACYMDALATGDYPAYGFSILYEYGLFKQKLVDGWQTELPDVWLPGGEVWLHPRSDLIFNVRFYGRLQEEWTEKGLQTTLVDYEEIEAVPYDMMMSGYDSAGVAVLRLWRARDSRNFDMDKFSMGDYASATAKSRSAELLSMVLYPTDSHDDGRSLRLKQQYFLVSASLQYITKIHFHRYRTFENFTDKAAIHINDTHPALCIPELMRIFLDDYRMDWDFAFGLVQKTMAYTNHTVMAEALETWPEHMLANMLPRIHSIIKEIDRRFPTAGIIKNGQMHMAHLAIVGSHAVNGVSKLHTDILKANVFSNFYKQEPDKFRNVTNGIAHRRWLCQANPRLCRLLNDTIGPGYEKDAGKLAELAKYADDSAVLERLARVKKENKVALANSIGVSPDAIFDVQVKRLHEYKRQLLNALHIITLYRQLKDNPNADIPPRVFLFGAKAAPSYYMAKQVISLIANLGEQINNDKALKDKLKVVFLENYSVTVAERLMPAADVSEQISLAGTEASGTGNMKLMLNGALT
ncbi:MAG: glycogen/starch/alpha-glucan family phosphorylase, partial [Clostridia bacterium]|nr:glycogen/starch/alpha-glucan family phosphorylase [Clostridia bacterium]